MSSANEEPSKITSPTSPETRIITHLNTDHQRELSHYLRHYAGLSARESLSPLLTAITFSNMTIRTSAGKSYDVPVDPPMATWADARIRAVEMDQKARSALGISDIYIDHYLLPSKVSHITVFTLSALNLVQIAAYYLGYMRPGSFLYSNILKYWPFGGAEGYTQIIGLIMVPVVLLHAFEAVLLDRWRLEKYGVVRGSGLWWKWVGMQFTEGVGNWFRFDAEVERKRKEKEKKAH